jgi:hypothetical protein
VKFSLSVLCRLVLPTTYARSTGTDRCARNQTNQSSVVLFYSYLPGSTGTDRCARNQTEISSKTEALGIHPIPPQSTSADPLTTSFKDTNRFFTAPNHGSYQYLYTETDKLSFFLTLRDAYAAGQHIRPNDPNKPEGEWNYPPTDTVLETAGLRWGKHSTPTRHTLCFASDDTPYIPAMFGIPFSFSLRRYAWCPLFPYSKYPYTGLYLYLYGTGTNNTGSNIVSLQVVTYPYPIPYRIVHTVPVHVRLFCTLHPGALDRL